MNTKTSLLTLLATAALFFAGCGDNERHGDGHEHHDASATQDDPQEGGTQQRAEFAKDPGPNGGRVITAISPAAEFFLRSDNKGQLTFLDSDLQPIPADEQSASLVTGDRMNPVTLDFVRADGRLVTKEPLPDIEGQPLLLTLQASPEASPVQERFNLKTYTCSGCQLQEYACICGH